jgi:hypothetical protein
MMGEEKLKENGKDMIIRQATYKTIDGLKRYLQQ